MSTIVGKLTDNLFIHSCSLFPYQIYLPSDIRTADAISLYPHNTLTGFFVAVPNVIRRNDDEIIQKCINIMFTMMVQLVIVAFVVVRCAAIQRSRRGNVTPASLYMALVGRLTNASVRDGDWTSRTLVDSNCLLLVSFVSMYLGCAFSGHFYSERLRKVEFGIQRLSDLARYGVNDVALLHVLVQDMEFCRWWHNATGGK